MWREKEKGGEKSCRKQGKPNSKKASRNVPLLSIRRKRSFEQGKNWRLKLNPKGSTQFTPHICGGKKTMKVALARGNRRRPL